ncbi:type I glutamate--ammonia ligase [Wohlfahrtiimonas sp. G9077]|uniref:type I glutamate--ammonia ligase n=1 Tax=Wohlfahrtiimonas sp. G9077 TaxID=1980118 RepID=UPI000B98FFD3|nr:type I glutamate--ammonia ligase [Wohlfahrtiimonas sp. G9077]OYQ73424.1 type I glutamate--ammonia ligase [Wohlfahrtiimonas sp. G9077]
MSEFTASSILSFIQDEEVKYVDLRFTDIKGLEHHLTVPARQINEDFFEEGKMFDGSSFKGWKGVEDSDMILMPDPKTARLDPFYNHKTLMIHCDIVEPSTLQHYSRDPRSIAKLAQNYLVSTGIADDAFLGPENEFFIFDNVSYSTEMGNVGYTVDAEEASWNSDLMENNLAHRNGVQGGYSPIAPIDRLHELRAQMCEMIEALGIETEVHHHEVASAGQSEIGVKFNTLVAKADETQLLKYAIKNTAHQYGKTATFMPKPLHNTSGSGMHVHISLMKDGKNLFTGENYAGLSDTALYFIGGVIKHAHALNAFTNPSTNSYKRLVPHFEAPVMLAYSAKNRSASIRIPYINNPKARRIEVRFPDSTANPYLAFAALLMAGLDGIQNKIHPGEAMDKDLYDLPKEQLQDIPQVCFSLEEAIKALDADRAFLKQGNVFNDDFIDAYIALKTKEYEYVNRIPHPAEFELYYSL